MRTFNIVEFGRLLMKGADATALLQGSAEYPGIRGRVHFYQTPYGALMAAELEGLPEGEPDCGGRMFGFHIHSGMGCGGNGAEPFSQAGSHYDPKNCLHPFHAGDLPPILEAQGKAFAVVLSGNFRVSEVLFRTVVLHLEPDDLHTQPAGASGMRIACGMILPQRWLE